LASNSLTQVSRTLSALIAQVQAFIFRHKLGNDGNSSVRNGEEGGFSLPGLKIRKLRSQQDIENEEEEKHAREVLLLQQRSVLQVELQLLLIYILITKRKTLLKLCYI